MIVIKRYATSSTNEELKKYVQQQKIAEPVCLSTKCQTEGKGQLGNTWSSEPFKNLACSFYFDNICIPVEKQFNLSVFAALAIAQTMDEIGLKNQIKWPNDILAENNQKISGILIENTLSGLLIKSTVIGIGINVNQKKFPDLPNASSIALELGRDFKIESVLNRLIANMENLNKHKILAVDFDQYYQKLYRFKTMNIFKDKNGQVFKGKIKSVTGTGLLQVYKLKEQKLVNYDMKEIKFIDQS